METRFADPERYAKSFDDPARDAPSGPPVEFRFPPAQIESEMREAGYRLVATHEFLPRQHFLVFEVVADRE